MARRFLYLALAILMVLPFTLFGNLLTAKAAAPTLSFSVHGAVTTPRTDGRTVVWTSVEPGHTSAYGATLASGTQFPLTFDNWPTIRMPSIDGDIVVCELGSPTQLGGGVYAKNIKTNQVFPVGEGFYPLISGDWVVYLSWEDGSQSISNPPRVLKARNINGQAEPIVVAHQPTGGWFGWPAVDGDRVVWMEGEPVERSQDHGPWSWAIKSVRVVDTNPSVLAEGKTSSGPSIPTSLDFHGDMLVYVYGSQLRMVNVKTGEQRTIIEVGRPDAPTTDGRYIFWQEAKTPEQPQESEQVDLWGWDSATGRIFPVAVNNGVNTQPYARGGWLVWAHRVGNDSSILAIQLSDLQPSTPIAPFTSTSDSTYFPETGHSLSYGFKYFWNHSGGLPVFGYPLTEEFTERNRDTGKDYTVQYFERQRFEYHPEFKGTSYETSLGRLGAEDAYARGITATDAFRPRTANSPNTAAQRFFPETTHWVSHSFLDYWKSHGLDFGDTGVSYRESLALFGLPLSEEFVDPETGFVTQYFERAVFEYHPEFKGTPFEVELRLLGRDVLGGRGWL
jgi:hypothetical protein